MTRIPTVDELWDRYWDGDIDIVSKTRGNGIVAAVFKDNEKDIFWEIIYKEGIATVVKSDRQAAENAATYHIIDGITVKITRGNTGLYYATSPSVKGLLVAEKTEEEALAAVRPTIKALAEAEKEFTHSPPSAQTL